MKKCAATRWNDNKVGTLAQLEAGAATMIRSSRAAVR